MHSGGCLCCAVLTRHGPWSGPPISPCTVVILFFLSYDIEWAIHTQDSGIQLEDPICLAFVTKRNRSVDLYLVLCGREKTKCVDLFKTQKTYALEDERNKCNKICCLFVFIFFVLLFYCCLSLYICHLLPVTCNVVFLLASLLGSVASPWMLFGRVLSPPVTQSLKKNSDTPGFHRLNMCGEKKVT